MKAAYWLYIGAVVFLLGAFFFTIPSPVTEITWQDFDKRMLQAHAVEKMQVVNKDVAEIYLKKDVLNNPSFKDMAKPVIAFGANPGPHYKFTIGSVESFEKKMDAAQQSFASNERPDVIYIHRSNWQADLYLWIISIVVVLIAWRYAMKKTGGAGSPLSVFNFGRSTAMLMDRENQSTTTFDDVAGLAEAKVEIKEIVDFLKDPHAFTRLGAKIPKGVLMVGPPGTGKTLLVKAVAGEANVPFFSISGSEFVEMFVGVGASRVRDLFRKAKEKAPCIVFIDEIDAVGRSRSKGNQQTGANDERESTLNQLLTEMDGFGTNSGVIVLAATNRADMLDAALLRPGRFDRHIYVDLPTLAERKAAFAVHLRSLVVDETIDTDFLAAQTPGSSGADIANICNEAALIAARRKRERIGRQDFLDAIDRIIAGLENKTKIISASERKIIAHHEAGHAVTSWLLKNVDSVVKVTVVPRGKSLGAAWYLPKERQLRSTAQFNDMICATLGGRVAEEIIFGDVTSGALDDLEKVTKQAYHMVAYYGFSEKVGSVSFYDSGGSNGQKPYSEETGKMIDAEVRKLVDAAYQRTKTLLTENKASLIALAELLLEKEVVYKEDLERILGKRETDESMDAGRVEMAAYKKEI